MEQQSGNTRMLTGIRPSVSEIAYRISAGASEYVPIWSLAVGTFHEQGVNAYIPPPQRKQRSQERPGRRTAQKAGRILLRALISRTRGSGPNLCLARERIA
jgi:hypothetical protein